MSECRLSGQAVPCERFARMNVKINGVFFDLFAKTKLVVFAVLVPALLTPWSTQACCHQCSRAAISESHCAMMGTQDSRLRTTERSIPSPCCWTVVPAKSSTAVPESRTDIPTAIAPQHASFTFGIPRVKEASSPPKMLAAPSQRAQAIFCSFLI
jgi:hypothetical protein